jgi:pyruvate,orthophosphate dikinase
MIHPLSAEVAETAHVLGGKGHGLVTLCRLGLPVPPGFVISTAVGRAFLRDGRLPDGFDDELAAAVHDLETATGRQLGSPERPLVVSVRSGGSVSMPGMMNTVLNVGMTTAVTKRLTDQRFACDTRERFLADFPGKQVPDNALRQLELAVTAVLSSWNTPRATTYRTLHDIPHDLGTAVTVQAMVFGNRDDHSGTGVAFSRDPNTGADVPFGEVLFGHQGEDVVSGNTTTQSLAELAHREPAVWADLRAALRRVEKHYRDVCQVEFTLETGRLWLLQVRTGGLATRAAIRVAVDLADAGVITREEALRRVSPQQRKHASTPRMAATDIFTRGLGACPGVATGRMATTADNAVRMAADGPVIMVRPHTSPLDMHGLAAAAGILTTTGGAASHAAVVARAMGKPAVVAASRLVVEHGQVRADGRTVGEGTVITIDGTSGDVAIGASRTITATTDPHLARLLAWAGEA